MIFQTFELNFFRVSENWVFSGEYPFPSHPLYSTICPPSIMPLIYGQNTKVSVSGPFIEAIG